MSLRRRTVAALAGTVITLGAVAAGCSATSSESAGQAQGQRPGGDGQRGGGFDTTALVSALATGLDLDEAKAKTAVEDAMSSVMGERGQRSGQPSDMPSGEPSGMPSGQPTDLPSGGQGDGSKLAEQLAAKIATALDVDQDKVLTIVEANLPTGGGRPSAAPTSS